MRINSGIIGTGKVALDHASVISSLGGNVYAGSASSIKSNNWKTFNDVYPNTRYIQTKEMLKDDNIDNLIVCTGWKETQELLSEILNIEKPVLIEKPISVEYLYLKEVLSNTDNKKNKYVGFNRRFYPTVQKLKKRVNEGGVVYSSVTISENIENIIDKWGTEILEYILAYSSCHILDLSRYILGDLTVKYMHKHQLDKYDAVYNYNGVLENYLGIPVFLSLNTEAPVQVGIRVFFDDGKLWSLSPIEKLTIYEGYSIEEPTVECNVRKYKPKIINQESVDTRFRPGFYEQMKAFLSNDKDYFADPEDFMSLLKLIEDIKNA